VAAALVVQQLFNMCPAAIGDMPEAERQALRASWFPRLLAARSGTPAQHKRMRGLREKLEKLGPLKAKAAREAAAGDAAAAAERLSAPQRAKLAQELDWRRELEQLEAGAGAAARGSAAAAIASPPPPLVDLRRPNEHRPERRAPRGHSRR
jgi:hypothetical protein